jgi:hypothetical protein
MTPDQIDRDQLRDYARRFINRWDDVFIGTTTGQWRCCRQAWTEEHLRQAVTGRISLGAYAVDRRGMSRWACLDLDDNVRGDRFKDIVDRLADPDAALLEYSRRGFHLWLFVEPSPWFVVQHWAKTQADRAGLTGIEVFPKSDGLNGVRLPLSLHPKSRQTYPVIDLSSGEVIEEPLSFIATRSQISLLNEALEPLAPPPVSIRQRLSDSSHEHRALVDEIERYTQLRFYGAEQAVGRCPMHDDRHPSLGVLGGFWRCFAGCGEGGLNAFSACMREKGGQ